MALLSDLSDGNFIYAADINARYQETYLWADEVDAAGHPLKNVSALRLVGTGGSLSTPDVRTVADPNTGLFWSAADSLQIVAGGAARATFDSTGISLHDPVNGIVVSSTGGKILRVVSDTAANYIQSATALTADSKADLIFCSAFAGTTFMTLHTTGHVSMPGLPSSSPGAGTKKLWYDPADGNRIKFAP